MSAEDPRAWLELPSKELYARLAAGRAIDPAALDDTEYLGVSLNLPALVDRLTWKTFRKVFCRDPRDGRLRGWNVRLEQRGLDGPYEPMRRPDGEPLTFGHYSLEPLSPYTIPAPVGGGLMIDYGRGGNAVHDPMRFVRDPLVALREDDASALLGWSYVDLGLTRIRTPAFFLLLRDQPLSHVHDPPRLQLGPELPEAPRDKKAASS